jgi:hypothetical protein
MVDQTVIDPEGVIIFVPLDELLIKAAELNAIPGKTKWMDVKIGFTSKEKTEVAGDLKYGNQLIAQANEKLKEGTIVDVKQ